MRKTRKIQWKRYMFLFVVGIAIAAFGENTFSAKQTPIMGHLQECANQRELPTFGVPSQQPVIEHLTMQDRWIVYSVVPQLGVRQFDLVLFDMGRDKKLWTPDDGQTQFIDGTHDVAIFDVALTDTSLIWIQNRQPMSQHKELIECSLPQCSLQNQQILFSQNAQYMLDGNLAAYGSMRVWSLAYLSGSGHDILMWCDRALDGSAGGCLQNDPKPVHQLGLSFNEQIVKLGTTGRHAYLLTVEQTAQGLERKLYLFDYATMNLTLYYSQFRDNVMLYQFAAEEIPGNIDILYLKYNQNFGIDIIGASSNSNTFSSHIAFLTAQIDAIAVNKESNIPLDLLSLQRNLRSQRGELVNFATREVYSIEDQTYQNIQYMRYNGKGYAALNRRGLPVYALCE